MSEFLGRRSLMHLQTYVLITSEAGYFFDNQCFGLGSALEVWDDGVPADSQLRSSDPRLSQRRHHQDAAIPLRRKRRPCACANAQSLWILTLLSPDRKS